MAYQPNDADTVLADFGVPVSWTGAPVGVVGLIDHSLDPVPLGSGGAVGEPLAQLAVGEAVLKVKPGTLAGVALDTRIVVDGKPYRLRDEAPHGPSLFEWRFLAPADA